MRFILTVVIWLVILGGLWSYTRQRAAAEAVVRYRNPGVVEVEAAYSLLLTPTFSLEPDPFALKTGDGPVAAVELRLNGVELPLEEKDIRRGQSWTLHPVPGLVQGQNEIFVRASPPLAESALEHGIRIRLLKSGVAAVDSTVWSQQGALVSGSVHFELEPIQRDHDH
jgi:hypothetical protein